MSCDNSEPHSSYGLLVAKAQPQKPNQQPTTPVCCSMHMLLGFFENDEMKRFQFFFFLYVFINLNELLSAFQKLSLATQALYLEKN